MEFKPNHLVQDEHSLVQRENHPCNGFIKFVTSHPYIAVAILCLASTVITTSASFGSLLPIFAIVPMLIVLFAGVPVGIYFSSKNTTDDDSRKKMAFFMSVASFAGAIGLFLIILMKGSTAFHILNYGLLVSALVLIYLACTDRLTDKAFSIATISRGVTLPK